MTYRPLPVRPRSRGARGLEKAFCGRWVPVVLIVVVAALVAAVPGVADPIGDKKAEAQRVLGEINQLDVRLGRAIEAYDASTIKLDHIRKQLADNRYEMNVALRNKAHAESRLARRLRELYISGQADPMVQVILGAQSLDDIINRMDTANRISAQDAQVLRQVRQRKPDGAEPVVVGTIHGGTRGALGQAVALEDEHVQSVEELEHLDGERRGAGDGQADAAAEALLDLRVDEPVGEAVLDGEADGQLLSFLAESACPTADPERPVDELAPRAVLLGEGGAGRLVDLLEDARHAREQCRTDVRQRLGQLLRIGDEGDREATAHAGQAEEAAEVVSERKPEQDNVVLADDLLRVAERGRHPVRVPVSNHARLRRAGRARRVDEGVEVVLVDGGDRGVEGVRVRPGELSAAGGEVVQLGEGQDVVDARDQAVHLVQLARLALVLGQDADRLRVVERVRAVVRRARRVDRDSDGADEGEGVVEEQPFDAGRREDPERVALADAERQEAVRELGDALARLCPRDGRPAALPLGQIRRRRPALVQRCEPQGGHGARLRRGLGHGWRA